MRINLEEIKQRWAKTTKGPWHCRIDEILRSCTVLNKDNIYIAGSDSVVNSTAIAYAPSDIALLIAEAERLREVVDRQKEIIDYLREPFERLPYDYDEDA